MKITEPAYADKDDEMGTRTHKITFPAMWDIILTLSTLKGDLSPLIWYEYLY